MFSACFVAQGFAGNSLTLGEVRIQMQRQTVALRHSRQGKARQRLSERVFSVLVGPCIHAWAVCRSLGYCGAGQVDVA
jgi:hypothetical protein